MLKMRRLNLLQVRASETPLVTLVGALFALIGMGMTISANAKEALYIDYIGASKLPRMYVALGLLTFLFMMGYRTLLSRYAEHRMRIAIAVPVGLALLLIIGRMLFYYNMQDTVVPFIWLGVEMVTVFMLLIGWNIAGEVNDTQQAKRLFPIYVSAAIGGRLLGNALTDPLESLIGTASLLYVYAGLVLIATYVLYRIMTGFPVARASASHQATGVLEEIRNGFSAIREMPLLRLVALTSVLNAALAFMVSFTFSNAVQVAVPTDRAGFFGNFYTVTTLVILLVSFFLASHLYARLGFINSLLILPVSYMVSFAGLVALTFVPFLHSIPFFKSNLWPSAGAQFVKFVVLYAVADGALNAVFNVIPSNRRSQVRTFNIAVAQQTGVVLSGVLIILTDTILTQKQVLIGGLLLAVVSAVLVWQMRQEYAGALIEALEAGRFEVFSASQQSPFTRYKGHATAINLARKALHDSDNAATRLVGAQMLDHMQADSARQDLLQALNDPDAEVIGAAIDALAALQAREAIPRIIERVGHGDYRVRLSALRALRKLLPSVTEQLKRTLQVALRDDEPEVVAQAAVNLALFGEVGLATSRLEDYLNSDNFDRRAAALGGIGQLLQLNRLEPATSQSLFAWLVGSLADGVALVRRAGCIELGRVGDDRAIEPLVKQLADPDETVRRAAAQALRSLGKPATDRVLTLLIQEDSARRHAETEMLRDAAMNALVPAWVKGRPEIDECLAQEITQLRLRLDQLSAIPPDGTLSVLLRDLLASRVEQIEGRLLKILGMLSDEETMKIVLDGLESGDERQRTTAIEAVQAVMGAAQASEVIPLLDRSPRADGDPTEAPSSDQTVEALGDLMKDQEDPWLRAIAARVSGEQELVSLASRIEVLTHDEDPLVHDAAQVAYHELQGGKTMDLTRTRTVSALERAINLRNVPLFAELTLEDLKQIADITEERRYEGGAVLFREGEEGSEMLLIVEGEVGVYADPADAEPIARLGKGEVVGEMALLDAAPRSATVKAKTDLQTLVLERDAFLTILVQRSEVVLVLLRSLTRRLRDTTEELDSLTSNTPSTR